MENEQTGISFAGCIGFGLIAVIVVAFAGYMILISSGPYSDAQLVAKSVVPIEHVRVCMTGDLAISWDVDDRFLLECGDGVVIRQGTNVRELSDKWGGEYVTEEHAASTEGLTYVVTDNTDDLRRTFMTLKVDEGGVVLDVFVVCGRRKAVKMRDLQSSREIGLYDADYDTLVKFFRSLPK